MIIFSLQSENINFFILILFFFQEQINIYWIFIMAD